MHQARQSVLRNEVLYILLLAQPRERNLELVVLLQPSLVACAPCTKALETVAAQAHEGAVEQPPPVVDMEFLSQ